MTAAFKKTPVTMTLLALTVLIFLAMQLLYPFQATSAWVVYQFGGMFGEAVKADPNQLWRLFSPLFVHIGWEHMLFNACALFVLGSQLELILGVRKFLLLYLLSGIMGNLFALLLTPHTVVAGASSSLYGLSGMFAVLYYSTKNPYLQQLGRYHIGFLLSGFLLSILATGVSLAGHLGGALGGALCAFMIPLEEKQGGVTIHRLLGTLFYIGVILTGLYLTYHS